MIYKILIAGLSIFCGFVIYFHSLSFTTLQGTLIHFNDFREKKVLLVNIGTASPQINQLNELEQLYQAHKDSLLIVAFPSNSFGNEPKNDIELLNYFSNEVIVNFPIAKKSNVKGDSLNSVYNWLHSKYQNDVMNARVGSDFQKFLINKDGMIVAVFDSSISPLSQVIQQAISMY